MHRPIPPKIWIFVSVVTTVLGIVSAVAFSFHWFTGKGCGLVRAYENFFGAILLGGWLAGLALGAGLAASGFTRKGRIAVPGLIIVVIINLVMVLVCAKIVHDIRAEDFSLKTTEQLLLLLADGILDDQKLATHELGERMAAEALPALCHILDDAWGDINLRHNAAIALGKIAAQPRSSEADVDRAVTSLVNALKSGDGTLPSSAAEALGRTGDSRAIHPLAEFLNDRSPSVYAREEAVRAIGKIGGNKARAALEKAHTTCQDEQLVMTINSVLRNLNQTSKR